MKLDPTCPVEVQDWELLRDDRAHARAYLHARNCADCALLLMEGCVRWIDANSGNYTENSFKMDRMNIEARVGFTIPVSASFVPQAVRLMVYFTRIVLADGSEWTGSAETMRRYPDQPVLPGHLANALCAAAGPDAVCCAQELDRGDWLCVCGRWNDKKADRCMRCSRDRAETLSRFHPEAVEQLSPNTAPVDIEPPMTDRMAAAPEEPARRSSSMKRVLIAVLLAALFACMALAVRSVRYQRSQSSGLMPTSNSVESIDF